MMSDVQLISAIPVLPVADLSKALAFYRDRLGFTPAFEYGPYGGVTRGPIEIHLNGHGPHKDIALCRVMVRGVDPLYAAIEPQGVVLPNERLETKPWGSRQFTVADLDGNQITFAERAQG
jgi:catechol 2,3-dioxygenase-like lactoylglutathione lyase family enzyme